MDTRLIRLRINRCSENMTKAIEKCNQQENKELQGFVIWLCGYLDGLEEAKQSTLQVMVDTLNKKKDTP